MGDDSYDKIGVETEKLRIRHAFLLSVFGLGLSAALTIFLVVATKTKVETSAEVFAIVGLFTSVTGYSRRCFLRNADRHGRSGT